MPIVLNASTLRDYVLGMLQFLCFNDALKSIKKRNPKMGNDLEPLRPLEVG